MSGRASQRHPVFLVLAIFLLATHPVFAQELAASFYPAKHIYLLGEPVWFVFEVTNKENVPVHIEVSNPYGVCALGDGYYFDVQGAMTVGRWRCGYGGSCVGYGSRPLPPGATFKQRLLLNQWFLIDPSWQVLRVCQPRTPLQRSCQQLGHASSPSLSVVQIGVRDSHGRR